MLRTHRPTIQCRNSRKNSPPPTSLSSFSLVLSVTIERPTKWTLLHLRCLWIRPSVRYPASSHKTDLFGNLALGSYRMRNYCVFPSPRGSHRVCGIGGWGWNRSGAETPTGNPSPASSTQHRTHRTHTRQINGAKLSEARAI